MKDYENSLKYGKLSLKVDNQNPMAYTIVGTVQDLLGKPKEAIKTYEQGIKVLPNDVSLNYNLGVTLYNVKKYKKAEEAFIRAINTSPTYASCHLGLSQAMYAQEKKIEGILASYCFLMLEPNSKRSAAQYSILMNALWGGVHEDSSNIMSILISPMSDDKPFMGAEFILSLTAADIMMSEDEPDEKN